MSQPAWTDELLDNPHAIADKRSRVQQMFSAIAPSYDLNNRLHSFWRDQAWRRKTVRLAQLKPTDTVVDVACGTGDLTLAFTRALARLRRQESTTNPPAVLGIDFTYQMLPIAQTKSQRASKNLPIHWFNGDAQALPLPDACCDVVSIAFGIRNVQQPMQALREFRRVLRPGGRLLILEFSEPINPLIRTLNRFYTHKVMPLTATLISGDKSGAYKYLPRSIKSFIGREEMMQMMREAGFTDITPHPMTFGVCVCYRGFVR
ncbi:MAG TPA: bifunctional demethylmenaquinone methyltransferase/2-methoxy-6-polyprenyl-1,4-benzoquinol methylase UbiE [Tepidisphaeraceae bacterium]|nr:bifunctional demethylmenaquinone methyltransferase/2-methoxy-6-polyprenyl-1,4-benzoquinol methylase UbiE [Tepidisphaeraceae bacterium]